MTKQDIRDWLMAGEALVNVFPYNKNGQDCTIFKTESLGKPDDVVYIPDISLNDLNCYEGNLSMDDINDILNCCYTTKDFWDEAYGNKKCAESLFIQCDWQHPNIRDLKDCTTDEEAKENWGETWEEMESDAVRLVGFIHKYADGTVSTWRVELSDEDEAKINAILAKYETEGESIRGNADEILLSEVV